MKLRLGVISCLWAATLFISAVNAKNCVVLNDDGSTIAEGGDIRFSVADNAPIEEIFGEKDVANVIRVNFTSDFFTLEVVDGKLSIATTAEFSHIEETSEAVGFPTPVLMDCADGGEMTYTIFVVLGLTNTYDPQFENFESTFQLPMPFPSEIEINTAFGVTIAAFDYDITAENIMFDIADPSGNFYVTPKGSFTVEGSVKPRYAVALKSKRLLNLSGPLTVVIIAKDSAESDARTSTATVTIEADPNNITPISFGFKSNFYTAEDDDAYETGVLIPSEQIELLEAPENSAEIKVALKPAPGNLPSFEEKFTATYDAETKMVTIEQTAAFTEEEDVPTGLALTVEVSEATSGFVATTVLHVSLPVEECPEQTTCEPCEETTCPTQPTCQPCGETCPTSPTCPPCPTNFPTVQPSCPTCAPCTTTTPKPPTSIEFEQDEYSTTVRADEFEVELFTVKAVITEGAGTIAYSIVAPEELSSRLNMDKYTGVLTLTRRAAPGSYTFDIIAEFVETAEKARVYGYLDVSSIGECVDGSTCFTYSLVTTEALEGQETQDLIGGLKPSDPNCQVRIDNIPAEFEGWFEIDPESGALNGLATIDYEDAAFANVETPQVLLRLQVDCSPPEVKDSFNSTIRARLQEAVTKQQMLVVVDILNANEHEPVFNPPDVRVGYPSRDFARQIFPGAIVKVQATDADKGDDERLRYRTEMIVDGMKLDEITGELYPVDGKYNYENLQLTILALDSDGEAGAKQGRLQLQIKIVDEGQVAVVIAEGATIEDASTIVDELNAQIESHFWGSLRNSYIAEDLDGRRASSRARAGGLLLVLYALDRSTNWAAASHEKIKQLLSGYQPGSGWTVAGIQTWEEAGGWDSNNGGGGGDDPDQGLTIAVIVLAVIVALCLIGIGGILYVTVFRKKRLENRVHSQVGVKNRTSFSNHRESIAVEAAKRSYVNGFDTPKKEEPEMEERKKSITVTFNDEPEVIPSNESVRL